MQGAALPAGGLHPPAGPERRAQGRQAAQGTAGRAGDVPGQRGAARGDLRTRRWHAGARGCLRPDHARHGGDRGPAAGVHGLVALGLRRRVRAVRAAVRAAPDGPAEPARPGAGRRRHHRLGGTGTMRVVATYNIKGGVGKTSTAVNLGYLAARAGLRTLIWDLDPQGSATYLFRVRPKVKGGGKALVEGRRTLDEAIKGTDFDQLDLMPADFSYRNLDLDLDSTKRPTDRLRRLVTPLHHD